MFDCDGSGNLDYDELLFLCSSYVNGFRKFSDVALATFEEIKVITLQLWSGMDVSHEGVITFERFSTYIEENDEIQQAFLHHLEFQMRSHAIKIYKRYFDIFLNCFVESLSVDSQKIEFTLDFMEKSIDKVVNMNIYSIVGKLIHKLNRSLISILVSKEAFEYLCQLIKNYQPRMHLFYYFHLM